MTNWDDIGDVHLMILSMATPLTQFLNGITEKPNQERVKMIWADVFGMDWDGDITILPKLRCESCYYPYHLIHTKRMYKQCKQYLNATLGKFYRNWYDVQSPTEKKKIPFILAAPMENMWFEELCDVLEYPIALANAAIVGGHVKFLHYLVTMRSIKLIHLKYLNMPESTPFDVAAENGHFEMIKYLHAAGNNSCSYKAMDFAAANGHLNIVKWLHQNRTEGCSDRAAKNAISNGHVEVIKYLRNYGLADNVHFRMDDAHGLEMIKYLHNECGNEYTITIMDKAASMGDLESVKYLHKHSTEGCTTEALDAAAGNGHLDVVNFLHKHRTEGCTTKAMDIAAGYGHFNIVRFLNENRTEGCTSYAMDFAALNGNFDIIKYLHKHRTEGCTPRAIDHAAEQGHLEIIKYLYENFNEEWTAEAMDQAAGNGYLRIVLFFHSISTSKCTTKAMNMAAANGHIDIVKFLHRMRAEGCSTDAMDFAAANGHFDIVKFLHEYRTEGCTTYAMDHAAKEGFLSIVEFLHAFRKEGCSDSAFELAAENQQWDILRFLLFNCTATNYSMTIFLAAKHGQLDIIEYILENRSKQYPSHAIGVAIANGHFEVVKYRYYPYHLIQTKRMYKQCKNYLDDSLKNAYPNCYGDSPTDPNKDIPFILAAPMENMRLDALCDVLEYTIPLANVAIVGGHVQLLNYLVTVRDINLSKIGFAYNLVMDIAAENGHLEMTKYLHATGNNASSHEVIDLAAAAMENMWFEELCDVLEYPIALTNAAIAGGHACACSGIDRAAGKGHLNIVKWLHQNLREGCGDKVARNVIKNGHVEVLKYLKAHGLVNSDEFCTGDARGLNMIKYLHECELKFTGTVMDKVAAEGDLESIKYLHEHSTKGCTTRAMDFAAQNGHLEVEKFLHENRAEGCTTKSMNYSAEMVIYQS
ncbi:hypothetical protein THRCLA_21086 [Thraustotheca clavata]|uniref:Uncharacterized protein n=1 Tax=Thraustotheca clavata TaxID=74557 RepID=A0A1W0A0D5_9STRA|nr:hypothetical protein THRCLA_21086 [Thraustotheca clavata]